MDKQTKAKQHESYMTMTLLSILLPLASLIVGLVFLTKDRQIDKKLGEHMVAFSVACMIIYAFIWLLVIGFQQTVRVVGG